GATPGVVRGPARLPVQAAAPAARQADGESPQVDTAGRFGAFRQALQGAQPATVTAPSVPLTTPAADAPADFPNTLEDNT
ncbi:hypothetical protein, partial [Kitasatospora kifunensis]